LKSSRGELRRSGRSDATLSCWKLCSRGGGGARLSLCLYYHSRPPSRLPGPRPYPTPVRRPPMRLLRLAYNPSPSVSRTPRPHPTTTTKPRRHQTFGVRWVSRCGRLSHARCDLARVVNKTKNALTPLFSAASRNFWPSPPQAILAGRPSGQLSVPSSQHGYGPGRRAI
jgi:hypothetical protein